MSNSTTLLDTIAANQASKEVVFNALMDAASPSMLWGRHASACNGLTWGYYGGTFMYGSTANAIANGTVALTASTTNYVYANATTGAVSVNTTGFPAGSIPLYSIVTGTATVTSYTDNRSYQPSALVGARAYDFIVNFVGVTTNGEKIRIKVDRAVTLPASLTGSYFDAGTAATASTAFTLKQNGTTIGSLTFAAAGTVPTVSFTGAVTFAAGDTFEIDAPTTADTTLADIAFTFKGSY